MLEDGIIIINVKGKSAFREFLRLLSRNKKELVLFLIDKDCATTRDDMMTEQVLEECGFSKDFCHDRIMLVGNQEFEDLFSIDVLVEIFNEYRPKKEGNWIIGDFEEIDNDKKYSSELQRIIWKNCEDIGNKWSKPELGNKIGKKCRENEIPQEVKDLFIKAREISTVN